MDRPTKLSDFDGYNFHIVPVSCAKCGADGLADLVIVLEPIIHSYREEERDCHRVSLSLRKPWHWVRSAGESFDEDLRCGECDEQTK
jgi:hypothetical protein